MEEYVVKSFVVWAGGVSDLLIHRHYLVHLRSVLQGIFMEGIVDRKSIFLGGWGKKRIHICEREILVFFERHKR